MTFLIPDLAELQIEKSFEYRDAMLDVKTIGLSMLPCDDRIR
jgi:hypothetical protein